MKKTITQQQAIEDGFVKVKSLKRCIKEKLIELFDSKSGGFFTLKSSFVIQKAMIPMFGKICKVSSYIDHTANNVFKDRVRLKDEINDIYWCFPLECIEK